jgi:hypothetical protein
MREQMLCVLIVFHVAIAAHAATREEYAALIERAADAMSASQLRAVAGSEAKPVSRYTVSYGLAEAFLARSQGKPGHAEKAKKILLAVNRCALEGKEKAKAEQFAQMEFCLYPAALMYLWLKELGQLGADEVARSEAMLMACADGVLKVCPERGAMNRAAWAGLGTAAVARIFPNAPHASAWREFAEKTWADWWSYRDTFEDSSGYNALWLVGVLLEAEQLGKEDQLKTAEVEALLNRFRELCSPVRLIPDYGDAIWSGGWAHWIAAFECGASTFGNPDLKQAAEGIFRYTDSQFARGPVFRNGQDLEALVYAWQWARDDLKPLERPHGSLYTRRHDPYGRTLFDKLVMRGGPGPLDAYVLVNLHDAGYHGHSDGGALSAFIANGSVLLHELGYHQAEEQFHNTFLVRPSDEEFLSLDKLFKPGRWYTAELDLRRPFTYTGGVMPDLKRITTMFFRIDDLDKVNAEFEFGVDEIADVDAEGQAKPLVGFSAAEEHKRWIGNAKFSSAQGALHAAIRFERADRSEVAWLSREFAPPIDLSKYNRLRVRWRSTEARLDPKEGIQFGLNGAEGTQRWMISCRQTYRETTEVEIEDFERVVYAKFTEKMYDCLGRPLKHMRELALVKKLNLLCVYDTVQFQVAGDYAVGPVWHAQNIVSSDANGFVCRDDWQWDDLTVKWASLPTPLRISFAGPPGTTIERVEKEFTEWGRKVPQRNHVSARWTGRGEPGQTIRLVSALLPLPTGTEALRDLKKVSTADASVVDFRGIQCIFGRAPIPPPLHLPGFANFLYVEGSLDNPRHVAGLKEGETGTARKLEWSR